MATAAEIQTLVTAAKCDICNFSEGMVWFAIAAALIDKANGSPVPSDPSALMEEAKCLECMVTPGLLPYVILEAIRTLP